jgi:hypothetical protein
MQSSPSPQRRLNLAQDDSPISANLFEVLSLPQNRHPERSASQIDGVTQRLWRGAEGTSAVLNLPMLLGAFQPPGPTRLIPGAETKNLLASCYGRRLHLHSRHLRRHALHWRYQDLWLSVMQHKEDTSEGFTAAYGCKRLPSLEGYEDYSHIHR